MERKRNGEIPTQLNRPYYAKLNNINVYDSPAKIFLHEHDVLDAEKRHSTELQNSNNSLYTGS